MNKISNYFIGYLITGIGFIVLVGCDGPAKKSADVVTQIDSLLQIQLTPLDAENANPSISEAIGLTARLKDDSLKMVCYNKIAYALVEQADTALFRTINRKGLALAEKRKDSNGVAQAHWNFGIYYLVRNRNSESYGHYEKAYNYFKNKDPYYAGKMLYHMAYIKSRIKDYTGSEILLYKAIAIFKPLGKSKQLYLCHNHLGAIYDNLNEYEDALNHYQIAYEYLDKVDANTLHLQDYQNNIGVLYQKLGKQEEAIALFNEALKLEGLRKMDAGLFARLIDNRAYSYFLMGVDEQLPEMYLTALHIRDSINNKPGLVMSHIHLGSYYLSVKDTIKSLQHSTEAYILGRELELNRDTLGALLLLADIDPENSGHYLREHIKLNETLIQRERELRNKFTRIEYDTDNYIKENKRLLREKIWISVGGAALMLILILLIVIYKQREKNKELAFAAEQQKADEKIYLLNLEQRASLDRGRMQERKRVAEELHDGVLARMIGIRLIWEYLKVKGDDSTLIKHRKNLVEMQQLETEIRNISHNMLNEVFTTETLYIRTIEKMLKKWGKQGGLKIEFKIDQREIWEGLDNYFKANVYKIMEEALHNAAEHSQAKLVIVNLAIAEGVGRISIIDDGRGFIKRFPQQGIGIKNMKSRTKKLGGKFLIDSVQNKGTKIYIQIPIKV